ncbi:PucR family transcriptional regulator [Streptomyces sp. ms191]|uniref:PucR family transcriptional regulator ligand-binding domain-containing protein n=1 Tax=Streptomyces sp. ms191 TaxID=1827978 RepID=UPI0011CDFACB|nr:PucR family transcriptional regulator [Streptomyces sp. ms191]TXS29815.1 PucR family transcriptional regulator [Streptomyces sp. ms191]
MTSLLGRRDLGLRLLAGPEDVSIHWVHTSEMSDPYPYLLGGELLMTAGVQLTDPVRYVARMVEAGAAALGFGVAPVYDTVPAEVVAACERYGLPLLEVPPETPFTAVARAVWRLMAEARHRELRRVTEAQQSLATAAARPAPVPAVLAALASRLGGRAVLFTAEGAADAAAGRPIPAGATRALRELARVVGPPRPDPGKGAGRAVARAGAERRAATAGAPASAGGDAEGWRLAAYALGGADGLTLGVATEGREPGDHTIAGVAVVLLSLLTAPHRGAGVAARDAALVRLLLGADPAEATAALGAGPWTVVHARGGDGTPFAAASLAAALGTPLMDAGDAGDTTAAGDGAASRRRAGGDPATDSPGASPRREAGGAGAPAPSGASPAPAARHPDVRLLLPAGQEVEPQPGWVLGASAPVGAAELAVADAQAARAVRRAEAARVPLARHRPAGLGALVDRAEAASYARALLAPLSDPLAETLRTWLSLHGSWDRTAVAMEIHRNTVRQRVARCAALLELDLDDADVRMELWFALRSR